MSNVTRQDIEELKKNWLHDPICDIEETEGFEAHREELVAFREEREAIWKTCFVKMKEDMRAESYDNQRIEQNG